MYNRLRNIQHILPHLDQAEYRVVFNLNCCLVNYSLKKNPPSCILPNVDYINRATSRIKRLLLLTKTCLLLIPFFKTYDANSGRDNGASAGKPVVHSCEVGVFLTRFIILQ